MLGFIFRKQQRVESLLYEYLDALRMAQQHFSTALNACLEGRVCNNFDLLRNQTHKFEAKADDIREDIKTLMYSKALIPESRGDVMGLLESIDELPRILEVILQIIETQKLAIPEFLFKDIKELVDISMESCGLLFDQVEALFKKNEEIRALVSKIDRDESDCDNI